MDLFLAIVLPLFIPVIVFFAGLFFLLFEIGVVVNVIRNRTLSMPAKLLWIIAVLIVQPLAAILCYMKVHAQTRYSLYA